MNIAVIVAAGSGNRFGSDIPKQFIEILGKPILIHTLEQFENCSTIDGMILVLSENEIVKFSKIIEKYNLEKPLKIVSGGETRAESVANGLNAIDSQKCEIVAVHDGARPLVSVREISETVETAKKEGAACLVGKVTDTIKRVSDGKIVETVDRENLRRALTPQAFKYEVLKKAFEQNAIGEIATDECFFVEKLGYEIAIVEGSARNIKITTTEDFEIAEKFLRKENV